MTSSSGSPYPPPTPITPQPIFNSSQYLQPTDYLTSVTADSRYLRRVALVQTLTGNLRITGNLDCKNISLEDGDAGLMALFFSSVYNSGFYFDQPTTSIRYLLQGIQRVAMYPSRLEVNSQLQLAITGNASDPSHTWVVSPISGMYYDVVGQNVGITQGANAIMTFSNANNITALKPIKFAGNGSVSSPAITTTGSPTSGIYFGTDQVNIATNGIDRFSVRNLETISFNRFIGPSTGTASFPQYTFFGDTTSGMRRDSSGLWLASSGTEVNVTTSGNQRLKVSDTATTSTVQYVAPNGTASTATYSFTGGTNTGLSFATNGTGGSTHRLNVVIDGQNMVGFDRTQLITGARIIGPNTSTASTPQYSFFGADTTGLRLDGNGMWMSFAGTDAMRFFANGVVIGGNSSNIGSSFQQIRRGSQNISCGAGPSSTTSAITFGSAFAGTPSVILSIQNAGSASISDAIVTAGSVSSTGFTIWISRSGGIATTISVAFIAFYGV